MGPLHLTSQTGYFLLIEWGCRLPAKIVKAHIALDVLNQDLRDYCKAYSEMWHTIVPQVIQRNIEPVKKTVEEHKNGCQSMASLRSRCIGGSTLLHIAAYHGELHIIKLLINDDADVNWSDDDGNTALHMICYGELGKPSRISCVMLLFSKGASKKKLNKKGLLPVHCAAMQGRIAIIELMIDSCTTEWNKIYARMMEKNTPSLPYLAAVNNHLDCAE